MIDLSTAKQIVETNFPGAKVREIYSYKKNFYLAAAPSMKQDFNDPFYIVGKADGKYKFLNPLEDIEAFNAALEAGPLKVYAEE